MPQGLVKVVQHAVRAPMMSQRYLLPDLGESDFHSDTGMFFLARAQQEPLFLSEHSPRTVEEHVNKSIILWHPPSPVAAMLR